MDGCVNVHVLKKPRINIAAGVNGQPNQTIDSLWHCMALLFVAAGFLSCNPIEMILYLFALVDCSFGRMNLSFANSHSLLFGQRLALNLKLNYVS